MGGSEPGSGVRDDGVAEVAVAGQGAEPLGLLSEAGGRRADPFLGSLRPTWTASQGTDAIPATVEVVELVHGQKHGRRGHALILAPSTPLPRADPDRLTGSSGDRH